MFVAKLFPVVKGCRKSAQEMAIFALRDNSHTCLRHFTLARNLGLQTAKRSRITLMGQERTFLNINSCGDISKHHIISRTFSADHGIDMPEGTFHDIADDLLEGLEPVLEVLEEHVKDGEFDVVYSQGVLTLELGEHGTWVLNKQTPNRQVWWSSPLSGPKRYYFDQTSERWLNTRDDHDLLNLFKDELKQVTGEDLDLD